MDKNFADTRTLSSTLSHFESVYLNLAVQAQFSSNAEREADLQEKACALQIASLRWASISGQSNDFDTAREQFRDEIAQMHAQSFGSEQKGYERVLLCLDFDRF